MVVRVYTKQELIDALKEIHHRGWVVNQKRQGNHGAMGNMLEDMLEIEENNLPIPNAAEWELKTTRSGTTALTTLFHLEPSPTTFKFVPSILLPHYGWRHKEAGKRHPETERSFRQTIHALSASDRGFKVVVNDDAQRIEISFDASEVDNRHAEWLASVENSIGLGQLDPQPYWGFRDLVSKAGVKLKNMFYVQAKRKREQDTEYFHYETAMILSGFSGDKFIDGIRKGLIYVDFDARTGHNHGTKFRVRQNHVPSLYENIEVIF